MRLRGSSLGSGNSGIRGQATAQILFSFTTEKDPFRNNRFDIYNIVTQQAEIKMLTVLAEIKKLTALAEIKKLTVLA
jgi:hypothetical protein